MGAGDMNITEDHYGTIREHELKDYVANELDGSDHERGALEEAAATSDNVARAFGRLVERLVVGGKLDLKDAHYIVIGWDSDCLKEVV
jgi:hypothetical protein